MQPRRIDLLQSMPIFGAVDESSLHLLLEHAQEVIIGPGECFFREHDEASSMFVLESGLAEVVKRWEGQDVLLHHLKAGDCFGEMALMDLQPRSATVRALERCVGIELDSSDLLHLYEVDVAQFAIVQMNIGREVCRRLRAMDEMMFRTNLSQGVSPPVGAHLHLARQGDPNGRH